MFPKISRGGEWTDAIPDGVGTKFAATSKRYNTKYDYCRRWSYPTLTECVAEITDDYLREEIATMVDNYVPNKTATSTIEMELVLEDTTPVYQHARRLLVSGRILTVFCPLYSQV